VLYHLSPEETPGAVKPASFTYCGTSNGDAPASGLERVAWRDRRAIEAGPRALNYPALERVTGSGFAVVAVYRELRAGVVELPYAIQPTRVAAALDRLDPPDREVLELSLRRQVPDEALAEFYRCPVPELARRRAAAIERFSNDLGLEGGDALGDVLRGLLDSSVWQGSDAVPVGSAAANGRAAAPAGFLETVAASSREVLNGMPGVDGHGVPGVDGRVAKVSPLEHARPRTPPRLGRSRKGRVRGRRGGVRRLAAAGVMAAAGVAATGLLVAAASGGRGDRPDRALHGDSEGGPFVPRRVSALASAFPTDPHSASRYQTAYVRRATVLRDSPGGRPKVRIPGRTPWGSPRVLSVVRQQDKWLGVLAPELKNGEIGWVAAEQAEVDDVNYSLHADLSRRELTVRRGGRAVRRIPVAIGAPATPTPTGRFAVTDKLDVTEPGTPYGCCVLVLTGHQTKLPPGWPGGDRLAVHSTGNVDTIGDATSLGCMRVDFREGRWLIRAVPLGAPLFIRR
jgi:L,D-transpeptidase catalytic domain